MYPYTIYIVDKYNKIAYEVLVNGYQQAISYSSFRSTLMTVPFKLQSGLKSTVAYTVGYLPYQEHDTHKDYMVGLCKETIHFEDLYEFYESIGYVRKGKKFMGLSYKKFLLERIDANENQRLWQED
jgi:hypothetical protein